MVLAAALALAGCTDLSPSVTCEGLDPTTCEAVHRVALKSLQPGAQRDLERAAIRPSAVLVCSSAPDCRPFADVELRFRSTGLAVTVTVSRLLDGRLVAETY